MADISISTLNNVVRDVYKESVNLLEKNDWFFSGIDTVVPTSTLGWDKVVIPYTGSTGFAQWIEDATAPDISKYGADKMELSLAKFYSKFRITDYQMQVLKSSDLTSQKLTLQEIVSNIVEAPKDEMTRLFFADKYGSFGTVSADGTATTTISVNFYSWVPLLVPGRKIKIGTVSEIEWGTADSVEVVSVDEDSITVNTAIDVANGDIIVDNYAYENGAWKTFNGIEWIADDGTDYGNTFQGKNRTTDYRLKGNRLTGTSNILSDVDKSLQKVVLGGRTKELVVLMWLDKYDEFVKALIADRNKTTNWVKDLQLTGWWSGIMYTYNGQPVKVVASAYAKKDRVYTFDMSALKKVILTDNSLINDAGGALVQENLAFYLISRLYGNIAWFMPRKTAKIVY